MIMFSLLSGGLVSVLSSRELKTSARILAFICPKTPRFSNVSLITENNAQVCKTKTIRIMVALMKIFFKLNVQIQ